MPNVAVFTPSSELAFKNNYDDFIKFAKNELTLFSEHEFNGQKGWSCDKWSWVTVRGKKLSILFGIRNTHSKFSPYAPPFSDFARAYVRYHQSLNHKNSTNWASSLTWLYKSLLEDAEQQGRKSVDILDVNNNVINRTLELIKNDKLSLMSKRNISISLKNVLAFLKKMRFKLDFHDFTDPFPKQPDSTIKVDSRSRQLELSKCPSDYQMLQVAEAFSRAQTDRQKYFTSLFVMLMCQPSRSIELNGLTTHSLQQSSAGRWFLMWHPAKGGVPTKKWIPKLLEDVVQQAFKRLTEISKPARLAAKFAYEHIDKFMLHEQCSTPENYPHDQPLTYDQFANALGLRTGVDNYGRRIGWKTQYATKWFNNLISQLNGVPDWRQLLPNNYIIGEYNEVLRVTKSEGNLYYEQSSIAIKLPCYNDLVVDVHNRYKTTQFPYYGSVKLWDCICLLRENEFHRSFITKPFSWIPVRHGMIADALGSNRKTKLPSGKSSPATSVFDELGITDEDGSALKLSTHQFRHWLNTKLIKSGEEDWLIARWSGRADISQNKAYDGRTPLQKSRLTMSVGVVGGRKEVTTLKDHQSLAPYTAESPPPPVILHDLSLPISLKALGVPREGVAQFTGLGYCVHNYAESPCVKNGDCVTCSEHVCLKGIPNTLDELRNLERLHQEQLAHAKSSVEEKVFGADRWVTSLGFKLSKIRAIIAILEDPNTEEGSKIRVPDELDVSPVKRSLNISETNTIPAFDLSSLISNIVKE